MTDAPKQGRHQFIRYITEDGCDHVIVSEYVTGASVLPRPDGEGWMVVIGAVSAMNVVVPETSQQRANALASYIRALLSTPGGIRMGDALSLNFIQERLRQEIPDKSILVPEGSDGDNLIHMPT